MFQGRVETMPIPERVFELCKITAESSAPLEEIREKIEPSAMNPSNDAYFGSILNTAKELKLIEETKGKLSYIGEKQILQKIGNFRKYCNSVVYEDSTTVFYQITRCFLDSNLEWLKYNSFTSEDVLSDVRKKTDIQPLIADYLRGVRFWVSFLGFGMILEKKPSISVLPNMYTALKDFLDFAKPEKKREYTISEFVGLLMPYAHIALHGIHETHTFNYAMSSALRMMHDTKEIELKRNPDSREVWNLYRQEDHAIISEITHIVLLKEVQ